MHITKEKLKDNASEWEYPLAAAFGMVRAVIDDQNIKELLDGLFEIYLERQREAQNAKT